MLTCANPKVSIARRTKFVPPAKSVTLSNLNPAATIKNATCIATVTIAHIAKLSGSTAKTFESDMQVNRITIVTRSALPYAPIKLLKIFSRDEAWQLCIRGFVRPSLCNQERLMLRLCNLLLGANYAVYMALFNYRQKIGLTTIDEVEVELPSMFLLII